MPRPRTAVLLALLAIPFVAAAGQAPEAGTESKLVVPGWDHPCVIWLPEDWKRGRSHPLILFMHGAGGHPVTWPWRQVTGGRGYLVVGLSYAAQKDGGKGGIYANPKIREGMHRFIEDVRKLVGERYGVDERRVLLTGLSMGGWGVDFYGFQKRARGRYRGYCILAAGIREEPKLDLAAAKGKPVLLLNGEKDRNRPHAERGLAELTAAGAKARLVIVPGQGHVPSLKSMQPHLTSWLEEMADADERRTTDAVVWRDALLDRMPAEDDHTLTAFVLSQGFAVRGRPGRPLLVFAFARASGGDERPSRAARDSTLATERAFRLPQAAKTAAVAPAFECVRLDLTGVTKRRCRLLPERSAPRVLIFDGDRRLVAHLDRRSLRDATLAAAMRNTLDPERLAVADRRLDAITRPLDRWRKSVKRIAALERILSKSGSKRRAGRRADERENELAELRSAVERAQREVAEQLGRD